ncbi:sensor histidine kinase [Cereibacter sphaeroides]|uniref:sensor histidine kinase n=1 Tax=Cereibacter sphaeroides TaxID=1063 RepID=UPI001F48DCF2|nr:sensor histidine kinase [Cereibacter sphaeroides]MCE6967795.1 sensor histidine kinase [Cereibacter sphaeroides]
MTAASTFGRDQTAASPVQPKPGDVLLGEDWIAPDEKADPALQKTRGRRGIVSLNRSPLARKIIIFNLLALVTQVSGVLFTNPFRENLVLQRERALVSEAQLVANVFEARLDSLGPEADLDVAGTLAAVAVDPAIDLFVFDPGGAVLASAQGQAPKAGRDEARSTFITDFLNAVWETVSRVLSYGDDPQPEIDAEDLARQVYAGALDGRTTINTGLDVDGGALFSVATPIRQGEEIVGVVAITSAAGEIDRLVRYEREQILQMFVVALFVSIGLSLVLASTIANPLADLAAAAELGRDRDARKMAPGRVRIPDLTARPDEIGRLSIAMRGMVAALYDRIDANEQFAADVAHEIKNPLASLRSAVGTLRLAKREDQRERLLDVIEHDVRRLDRLVSDISNASRLDSELVKEEEEEFDLLRTISNLGEYLGKQAAERGVDFITDLPTEPICIRGLEARLAQVFVNLITNALSFCEEGDAVRVWARRRENRVLVVVEDTGPGIPEQALTKIFRRFYSERPEGQFGNHSGLGLAISKQIVEAHGGVIWAENIRPTNADITSEPLGARFVVGLPV